MGRHIESKIDKSRKNRVLKTHLKPIPQKTSKISDSGRLRDLPNRAETLARTPFSQIHPITKQFPKLTQTASILETLRTPKSRKVRKSDLQKNSWRTSSTQGRKSTENDSQRRWFFLPLGIILPPFCTQAPKITKFTKNTKNIQQYTHNKQNTSTKRSN